MEKRSISFSPPDISELEIKEVCEALRSGWITTGPRVKEFEKRLANYIHTDKVVCLASATAAEELILRILGIGEGDEVLVPAYTYTSSAAAARDGVKTNAVATSTATVRTSERCTFLLNAYAVIL